MLTLAIIASSIVQLGVSILVFKKGRHNASYLIFFWLSIVALLWGLLSYLSINMSGSPYLIYVVRGIMFLATIEVALFYSFALVYPHKQLAWYTKDSLNYVLVTIVSACIALSPWMFTSVSASGTSTNVGLGIGIVPSMLFLTYSIISAFKILIRKRHMSIGLKRTQLTLFLFAAVIYWLIIPTTNFILTLTLKTLIFVMLSPIFTLLFSSIIAYALLRHRLFDAKIALWDSTIYIDYYLKNHTRRDIEYYQIKTIVDESDSNHIALDFTSVKELDSAAISILKYLFIYMKEQGKKVYLVGYNKKVFKQLRPSE